MVTIEELMIIASKSKASDVHITVGIPPKMRVNGELINMNFPALMPADTKNIITPIFDHRHKEIYEEKEGRKQLMNWKIPLLKDIQ